jgi:Protein O-mannosyl-transferase TMEM260-like
VTTAPPTGRNPAARDPRALLLAGAPVLVAIVAYALARSVLLPGQGFWDTGEFQAVPPLFGTAHPTGYPSYVTLGWLASLALTPAGEPALRMNLLSAILLAASAGLTVVLVRQVTGRTSVAVGAGLLLALTPVAWRMGALADPHTLHLALTALLLVVLVGWDGRRRADAPGADRWLVGAAAVYGVMLGNHSLTTLLAPGIALYVLAVEPGILRRRRFVGLCAGVLLATTAILYLQLPIRAAMGAPLVYGTPNTWDGFWYVVLGAQFLGDLDPIGDLGRRIGDLVELAGQQLGILAAAVPAAFVVVAARRPRFALLTAAWLGVTCWFAASYTNADIGRYYLVPALIAIAWLGVAAGSAADAAEGFFRGRGQDPVARPAGALVAALLAVALVVPAAIAGPITHARIDLGNDTAATDWSRWALRTVGEDAVIVSWWSYSTPLWYRTLVLGERPDVQVVDDRDRLDEGLGTVEDVIRANLGTRPVYLIREPSELAELEIAWELEVLSDPSGVQPLYRVVGPRSAGRPAAPGARIAALPLATMSP